MTPLAIATIFAWALTASGIAWYVAVVAKEVTYVTLADGRQQERSIPLMYRTLLPFVGNFDTLLRHKAFAKQIEQADEMLVSAGYEGLLNGREFAALKFLMPIALGPLSLIFAFVVNTAIPDLELPLPILVMMAIGYGYVQPLMWLRSVLKARHHSIERALPFVLDILTLSVEAGMDFISALQRNCANRKLDPLNEELLRMTKEIQIGSSRKLALKNMADRVKQPDLRSVAFALIQADELGVSIGAILRIQSEQLRSRRFDRAEKLAAEAPVKMMGPLLICIFPAVFIILLGPILSQTLKGIF